MNYKDVIKVGSERKIDCKTDSQMRPAASKKYGPKSQIAGLGFSGSFQSL